MSPILDEIRELRDSLEDFLRVDEVGDYIRTAIDEYHEEQEDKHQDERVLVEKIEAKLKEVDAHIEYCEKQMKNKHELQDDAIDQIARSLTTDTKKKSDQALELKKQYYQIEQIKRQMSTTVDVLEADVNHLKRAFEAQLKSMLPGTKQESSQAAAANLLAHFKTRMVTRVRKEVAL